MNYSIGLGADYFSLPTYF